MLTAWVPGDGSVPVSLAPVVLELGALAPVERTSLAEQESAVSCLVRVRSFALVSCCAGLAEPVQVRRVRETVQGPARLESRTAEEARTVAVLLAVARMIHLGAASCVAIPPKSVHQDACRAPHAHPRLA